MSYFRGKLYNELKQQGARNDLTSGQSGTKLETAERLSQELKASPRTIKRDAQYADAVDTLAEVVGDEVRPQLLTRESKLTKRKILELATDALDNPNKVKRFFDSDGNQKDIVEQIKERHPVPFPYRVGDVCCISAKSESSLRKYAGYWGIILEVGEFSARVGVWDGEISAVKPENLNEHSFSPAQKAEMAKLRERLIRLRLAIVAAPRLEKTGLAILREIGLKQDSYLSEIEEKLLRTLEAEYLDGQD